jgi:5-carboxyvanillate decarboxylase
VTDYLRIATEEAFAPPELISAWRVLLTDGGTDDPGFRSLVGYYAVGTSEPGRLLVDRLLDLGELRLAEMAAAGIDRQILSLTAPGTQVLGRADGVAMSMLANDYLAEACRRHPDKFSGLTAIAPQDAEAAAQEIQRGHDQLGLKGVIINSHTGGEYLDDPKFWPIFEAAEALGTPVYLHPSFPPRTMIGPLLESGLDGPVYGFAIETGMHVLRIIFAGVFDRFPALKLVVGHLGEGLPFWLYRTDQMHGVAVRSGRYESVKPIGRKPSEYLRENVWVTTSGMPWGPAVMFCREVLGADRVLYAMDYPYQNDPAEVVNYDELPISNAEKADLFQHNAERVFGL